jgi:hypothetical protein
VLVGGIALLRRKERQLGQAAERAYPDEDAATA